MQLSFVYYDVKCFKLLCKKGILCDGGQICVNRPKKKPRNIAVE